MTLFPDVMKKAQAEIDAVVGNDRLPDFSDRENLPYVDALSKEVFRWHATAPTGQNGVSSKFTKRADEAFGVQEFRTE
jgi:hypothetical protein